jgi:hypothetical protein
MGLCITFLDMNHVEQDHQPACKLSYTPHRYSRSAARMLIGFVILLSGFAVVAGHLVQLVSGVQ